MVEDAEISTHAPLAGRDYGSDLIRKLATIFQPTRPLRGATRAFKYTAVNEKISTHAPLAGRDYRGGQFIIWDIGISTHAPLAGRDSSSWRYKCGIRYFNPRAPCGARQDDMIPVFSMLCISTHAPLAGRDCERLD